MNMSDWGLFTHWIWKVSLTTSLITGYCATAAGHAEGKAVEAIAIDGMKCHHELTQIANRDFRLEKASGWDSIALERIEESTKEGRGAELGAIVCGEGTAAICLLSEHMTTVRQRIDTSVPRKRKGGTSGHDKVGSDI
jgi:protein pelota